MRLISLNEQVLFATSYFRPLSHVRFLVPCREGNKLAVVTVENKITIYEQENSLFYTIGYINPPIGIDSISFSRDGAFLLVQSFNLSSYFDGSSYLYNIKARNIKEICFTSHIAHADWCYIGRETYLIAIVNEELDYAPNLSLVKIGFEKRGGITTTKLAKTESLEGLLNLKRVVGMKAFCRGYNFIYIYFSTVCDTHYCTHSVTQLVFFRPQINFKFTLISQSVRFFTAPIINLLSNEDLLFVVTVLQPENQPNMCENTNGWTSITKSHPQLHIFGPAILSEKQSVFIFEKFSFILANKINITRASKYTFHVRADPRVYSFRHTNSIHVTNELIIFKKKNYESPKVCRNFDKQLLIEIQSLKNPTITATFLFPVIDHMFAFLNNTFIFSTGFTLHSFGTEKTDFGACNDGVLKIV
jgi:hypothetical protein